MSFPPASQQLLLPGCCSELAALAAATATVLPPLSNLLAGSVVGLGAFPSPQLSLLAGWPTWLLHSQRGKRGEEVAETGRKEGSKKEVQAAKVGR